MRELGYYLSEPDGDITEIAVCYHCYHNPVTPAVHGPEDAAIFSWEEADCPTHCSYCGDLIPHALTHDGYVYVADRVSEGDGRREVLMAWAATYL